MLQELRIRLQNIHPEDPRRIQDFQKKLQNVQWDKDSVMQSLSILFKAIDELAAAEVDYYYRKRGTRAWVSSITRIFAWAFGSVGLLLPLLPNTNTSSAYSVSQYGYAFLAAAASSLAANSLFGGTYGHIRYVVTQLELENLIKIHNIEWSKFLAQHPTPEEAHINQGFNLVSAYAKQLHETTIAETKHWGDTLLKELEKYGKTLDVNNIKNGTPNSPG